MSRKISPEKRQKIITAAISILNQKELSRCLMDDIARQAGVAKGTLYLYFKSKYDLYRDVLYSFMDSLKNLIDKVNQQNISAEIKLKQLIERIAEFLQNHRRVFFALQLEASNINITKRVHQTVKKRFSEKVLSLAASLEPIMQQGIKEKVLKNYSPRILAAFFLALLPVLIRRVAGPPELKEFGLEITPELLYKFLLKGIGR